jgi:hypothetical protein
MGNKQRPISKALIRPTAIQEQFEAGRNWSISFRYFDSGSKWSWPDLESEKLAIFEWLNTLNECFDLSELTNLSSVGQSGFAHHWIPISSLNQEPKERINFLLRNESYQELLRDQLFSMRYCYRPRQSKRLIVSVIDYIIYPIWWDPNHDIYGAAYEKTASGLCKDFMCHHKEEKEF